MDGVGADAVAGDDGDRLAAAGAGRGDPLDHRGAVVEGLETEAGRQRARLRHDREGEAVVVIVKYSPYPGRTCALEGLVMVGAVPEAAYEAAGASETPSTANVAPVAALATLCRRRRNGGWPFVIVLIFMLSLLSIFISAMTASLR